MTTVTINIPDAGLNILSDLSSLVKNAGGSMSISSDNASVKETIKQEFKEAFNEALDIIEGKMPRKTLKEAFNE